MTDEIERARLERCPRCGSPERSYAYVDCEVAKCDPWHLAALSSRGDAGAPPAASKCPTCASPNRADRSYGWFKPGETLLAEEDCSDAWHGTEAALAHREAPPLQKIIDVIENEPLGYRTEDEHAKLESFADRCIAKILQLPIAHREAPQDEDDVCAAEEIAGLLIVEGSEHNSLVNEIRTVLSRHMAPERSAWAERESAWQAEREQWKAWQRALVKADRLSSRNHLSDLLASGPQPIPEGKAE